MLLLGAGASSGCPRISSVALIIWFVIVREVIIHVILVLLLHLQQAASRQMAGQGWSETCGRQCKRKGKTSLTETVSHIMSWQDSRGASDLWRFPIGGEDLSWMWSRRWEDLHGCCSGWQSRQRGHLPVATQTGRTLSSKGSWCSPETVHENIFLSKSGAIN